MCTEPERSLAGEPLKKLHVKNFVMANSTNPEDPTKGTELNSTGEVEDDLLDELALKISHPLMSVLTNLNRNMDHMAGSLSAMGEAFAALSKWDARSGNLDALNGETKKSRVKASDKGETGSESDDADVHEILAASAENDSEGTKTSSANSQDSCKNEGEDKLLKKLALDFSKDD